MVDQFAVYRKALTDSEVVAHANSAVAFKDDKSAMVASSFDNGSARDESGHGADGMVKGVDFGKGKVAAALWFRKQGNGESLLANTSGDGKKATPLKAGSAVQHSWEHPVPLFPRAMAMAGKTMMISGPADMVNEEVAMEQLSKKDPNILVQLKEQDEALDGKRGASLWAVSAETGKMGAEIKLKSPPVWDGMAIARGRVFVATTDGKVVCFGSPKDPKVDKKLE